MGISATTSWHLPKQRVGVQLEVPRWLGSALRPPQVLLGFDGTSSSAAFCLTLAAPPRPPILGSPLGSEMAGGRASRFRSWGMNKESPPARIQHLELESKPKKKTKAKLPLVPTGGDHSHQYFGIFLLNETIHQKDFFLYRQGSQSANVPIVTTLTSTSLFPTPPSTWESQW